MFTCSLRIINISRVIGGLTDDGGLSRRKTHDGTVSRGGSKVWFTGDRVNEAYKELRCHEIDGRP